MPGGVFLPTTRSFPMYAMVMQGRDVRALPAAAAAH
jgi:hypothetical protein